MTRQRNQFPALDPAQVERLMRDPSAETRAGTAALVGGLLDSGTLSESERALALEIITVLAKDVSEQVRKAICDAMKRSPILPPEVARNLADDVEEIAVPLLKVTEVLSESDLIEVVRNGNLAKQLAIAQRPYISEPLSDALTDTDRPDVIATLLENPGAQIAEDTYHKIVDRLHSDARIEQAIVRRVFLPLTVVHRVIHSVATELREQMVEQLGLPQELVKNFIQQGWESTLSQAVHKERRIEPVERLVDLLHREGGLSPVLVLRTLLEGDLHFFEVALSRLAAVPLNNTRILLQDGGHKGLNGLYIKSGLPAELHHAFQIAVEETYQHRDRIDRNESPIRQQDLTGRIIDRLVVAYREIFPSDLEAVFDQLSRLIEFPASAPAAKI